MQFIHTALKCSDKGKLTVTFATLRKALKDNLLILEFLNADKRDFFRRFNNPSQELIIGGISEEDKKKIIKNNCKIIGFSEKLGNGIHDLRYKRGFKSGLASLFDQALHITTNNRHFKTERQNFNFIFSGTKAIESQWKLIYNTLPLLMMYFVQTSYHLLNKNITKKIKKENYLVDFIFWKDFLGKKVKNSSFKVICNKCKRKTKINNEIIKDGKEVKLYLCKCKEIQSIFDTKIISN